MQTTTMQQLELAFENAAVTRPEAPQRPPLELARWWFARMRRTIAGAMAQRRQEQTDRLRHELDETARARVITGLASSPPAALAKAA